MPSITLKFTKPRNKWFYRHSAKDIAKWDEPSICAYRLEEYFQLPTGRNKKEIYIKLSTKPSENAYKVWSETKNSALHLKLSNSCTTREWLMYDARKMFTKIAEKFHAEHLYVSVSY